MASGKCVKPGTIKVKVCRDKKGKFTSKGSIGRRTAARKAKKYKSKKACIPGTTRRYGKMTCACKTRGGALKRKPNKACKRKRR